MIFQYLQTEVTRLKVLLFVWKRTNEVDNTIFKLIVFVRWVYTEEN